MEKWLVAAKKADFNKWAEEFHIDPVVARILRNRDLTEEEQVRRFLYGTLEDCHSPWLLKDMEKAVAVVWDAVREGKKIRVIGDYDVDGICSSYILTKGFAFLGANVDTAIPHRIHDGYGLNDHLIELAKEDGVELIVTCDNGIAAAKQIELANSLGIEVVVTDHHEVPYETAHDGEVPKWREILPPAAAVVDPKQSGCGYPFKGICGGVVAYKLIQAMVGRDNSQMSENSLQTSDEVRTIYKDLPEYKPENADREAELMEELLEFAAFSTVCDVMELVDENRILVREGLKRMRHSRNLGLQALMEVNELKPAEISAYHLGFILGPCLNATGRLDTAKRALELLQSETKTEAMSAARELKELNDSRKNLTVKGVEQAQEYLKERCMEQDKVLVIFLPEVHESLAGIIAGRIREQYNRPVIVLTRGEEGIKGSGRSIETYHMYDALTQVKELFAKYGGHKMAAGLSLKTDVGGNGADGESGASSPNAASAVEINAVEQLRRRLNENCALTEDDFIPRIHIDVPMPVSYASEALAEQLQILEPFGVGNPKPLFAQKNLKFVSGSRMGAGGKAARFRAVSPDGAEVQLLLFRNLEGFESFVTEKYGKESVEKLFAGQGNYEISVTYQLNLNTYRGRTEKQLIIQNFC